jgi:hypothetical protein
MPSIPQVKLSVDLHKIGQYFPFDASKGINHDFFIERQYYNEIESLLDDYGISDEKIIKEFSFMLLWIEDQIQADDHIDNPSGKLYHMWMELDNLKHYLMHHRITSISLHGEYERNKPGKTLSIREEINIDRLCDGIRSIFREDFMHDKNRRRTKGQKAWQRRKMVQVSNNILNYFTTIPTLDDLSLEEQNELIGRIAELAGLKDWKR